MSTFNIFMAIIQVLSLFCWVYLFYSSNIVYFKIFSVFAFLFIFPFAVISVSQLWKFLLGG